MILRGSIFVEEAYALGKMLDHSTWQLPRCITPSDVDMGFDNNGAVLFCEMSSSCSSWAEVKRGQRLFYQNSIRERAHCAALCKHSVDITDNRRINSQLDVESFDLMLWDHGPVCCGVIVGNNLWQRFVQHWYIDPVWLRRRLLGRSVGMLPTKATVPTNSNGGPDAVRRFITGNT